ncbi:MAG TPA: hypothetical protein VLT90_05350 [Terriglobales bacterium]|nr:hypothetical protein [Terriglobales bacterium]
MKCFNHPDVEAVGTCKQCSKGLCSACAKDTGAGLVCSSACEEDLKIVRAMLERSRKIYPLAAKTHSRNAIWLTALALVFIVFGVISERGFLSRYLIAFGVVVLLGAVFSAFNSRRLAKL